MESRAVAEDLVQDCFLSALANLAGFRGESSLKSWLFTILRNKIIDHYRKKRAEPAPLTLEEGDDPPEPWFNEKGHWNREQLPRDWSGALGSLEQKELRRFIQWCKDRLRDLQQQVFILRYLEDMESDEICKVLEISASNYWVLLHRARLQMRGCLEKHWLQQPGSIQ